MSSNTHLGRATSGAAAALVLGAMLLTGPAANAAVVPGTYSARAVTATTPVTNTGTTITLTFANLAPADSFDFLHHATATFPAGFSGLTGPSTASSNSPAGAFSVTYSGLTASLASTVGIPPTNGEVSVDVSVVTPIIPGIYTLTTTASGTVGDTTNNGAYARVGPEPSVTVGPTAGTTYCTNGADCDTGYIGSEGNTLARIVTTGGGNDAVTISLNAPQYSCSQGTNQGQQVTYETQNLTRVVTGSLELDKKIVQQNSNSGAAHFNICYESKTPFTQYGGSPAVPFGGFFIGELPLCSNTGNVAPCLLKLKKTGSGDLFGTYLGQPGDPGGTWQLVQSIAGPTPSG